MSKNDPIIDRIRAVRKKISIEFQHDPRKLVNYYIKKQKEYQNKLIESK